MSEKKKMGRPIIGEPKDIRLTIRVDEKTYKKLIDICEKEKTSQSELIRRIINEY